MILFIVDVLFGPLLYMFFGDAANVVDFLILVAQAHCPMFSEWANEIVEAIDNIVDDCIVLFAMVAFNAIAADDLLSFDEVNYLFGCPIGSFERLHAHNIHEDVETCNWLLFFFKVFKTNFCRPIGDLAILINFEMHIVTPFTRHQSMRHIVMP